MSPADWSGALALAASFAFGYLLGSIPFGLILGKLAGLGDVREIGSGNIGATNVLRAGSKKLAAVTLLLDAVKGTAAVLIAARFGGEAAAMAAGAGAFLGHLYPVWLGFRGGKGVATYIGVMLGLYWPAALAFCAIWLLVALVTRYSSLAALAAAAATPAILAALGHWPLGALALAFTVLLIVRHRSNIERLVRHEETRIGEGKP
jgi:glycerol-3-phosphate acyltransferase PlsY